MIKIGGEQTRGLTELLGNFEKDKRLIKLMLAHLAEHASNAGHGKSRLRQILLTMGSDGVLIYNVPQKEEEQDIGATTK